MNFNIFYSAIFSLPLSTSTDHLSNSTVFAFPIDLRLQFAELHNTGNNYTSFPFRFSQQGLKVIHYLPPFVLRSEDKLQTTPLLPLHQRCATVIQHGKPHLEPKPDNRKELARMSLGRDGNSCYETERGCEVSEPVNAKEVC